MRWNPARDGHGKSHRTQTARTPGSADDPLTVRFDPSIGGLGLVRDNNDQNKAAPSEGALLRRHRARLRSPFCVADGADIDGVNTAKGQFRHGMTEALSTQYLVERLAGPFRPAD